MILSLTRLMSEKAEGHIVKYMLWYEEIVALISMKFCIERIIRNLCPVIKKNKKKNKLMMYFVAAEFVPRPLRYEHCHASKSFLLLNSPHLAYLVNRVNANEKILKTIPASNENWILQLNVET